MPKSLIFIYFCQGHRGRRGPSGAVGAIGAIGAVGGRPGPSRAIRGRRGHTALYWGHTGPSGPQRGRWPQRNFSPACIVILLDKIFIFDSHWTSFEHFKSILTKLDKILSSGISNRLKILQIKKQIFNSEIRGIFDILGFVFRKSAVNAVNHGIFYFHRKFSINKIIPHGDLKLQPLTR